MAFAAPLLPLLATVGGGSAIAGGIAVAGLAAGVASAAMQYKAGQAQSAQYKEQAKSEEVAAGQREIERRRSLIRALSAQNASAGAAGVETSGSIGGIIRRDIKDNQNDLLYDSANTKTRQRAFRSRASNSVTQGTIGAATSLIDTGKTYYKARG
jgi:hypothetical protein